MQIIGTKIIKNTIFYIFFLEKDSLRNDKSIKRTISIVKIKSNR